MTKEVNYHAVSNRLGGVQVWALPEGTTDKGSPVRINLNASGKDLNEKGWGIFHTVNSFVGPRQKKNLVRVNSWFVEIDDGTKPEMLVRIRSGLKPTMVVESKRGYHVYFACLDTDFELCKKTWDEIMKKRLIPFYGGDKKAADICRLLRRPGYFHMKDPSQPFMVNKVFETEVGYTVSDMLRFYPNVEDKKKVKKQIKQATNNSPQGETFWSRAFHLDCRYALEKLSGTEWVNNEVFEFKTNSSGTHNILVNGSGTSCWLDHENRIGSAESGGPSIANWLYYYHHDWKKVAAIIEKEFPECIPTIQHQPQEQLTLL